VTIIVPFAPGGTVDIMGRLAAATLEQRLKKPFIIENRTGAGGTIGSAAVARSAPDGQTLLLAPTAFAIAPYMYKTLSFDPLNDFKAVGLMAYTHNVIVASPSLNVKTLDDFIKLAKAKAGSMNYASPGVGTPQHLYAEYFLKKAGVSLQHVPYRGSSPALIDVVSGQVAMMLSDIAPAVPLIESGQLTALAVMAPTRLASLPNVPSVSETIPGFSGVGWQGLLARAGTPDSTIKLLNDALVDYLKTPDADQKMRSIGVDVKWSTPAEAQDWIATQLKQFSEMVPAAGINPE
jgi:tripartite-type tricarboxylate transporter receptor subunit TctC